MIKVHRSSSQSIITLPAPQKDQTDDDNEMLQTGSEL
jgi:hypothetical protein